MEPLQRRSDRLAIDEEACEKETSVEDRCQYWDNQEESTTYLNNIIRVPTRLPTLVLSNEIESRSITLAVVRLNRTSVSMNFQKAGTVGTRPTSP